MFKPIISSIALLLISCTAAPVHYSWQDTRTPAREDSSVDLEECKAFTARQYKPGIPAGEPYLKGEKSQQNPTDEIQAGTWRADRSPFQETNINSQPTHNVPVEYTGYPGELDYYPDYLDDILEKCMKDKGWSYLPTPKEENNSNQ